MFTGDSSGDWLYEALHRLVSRIKRRPVGRSDGLRLRDCYVTAAARCAPPGNARRRRSWRTAGRGSEAELLLLTRVKVVVVLGKNCA